MPRWVFSARGRSNGPGRNVEPGEPFPRRSAAGQSSEAEYEAKLVALAATIGQLNPDVLGVQEVGGPEALADLVAKLGLSGQPSSTTQRARHAAQSGSEKHYRGT